MRHNCWANIVLIEFCAKLPAEQLTWTTPGTYGTIHATLRHIVFSEYGYLFALTNELPVGPLLAPDQVLPLDELLRRARSNAERVEGAFAVDRDWALRFKRPSGAIITPRMSAAQFIHHGSDHRAHIGTILGAHGLETPDLDVWAYGTDNDAVKEERR